MDVPEYCLNLLLHVVGYLASAAPPDFDAPTFYRVVSDTKLVIVLYPASPENGDITHYYVVVVPDQLTHGRRSDDFKLHEVSSKLSTRTNMSRTLRP